LATAFFDTLVLAFEDDLVDLFAPEEGGITRFGDAHLAQHLTHDDFDVLVVDRHTLETINFLHFVDEVLLQFLRPADVENFMRDNRTFSQLLAFLHEIALEDNNVFADRNEVFLFRAGLRIFDDDRTFATNGWAEIDHT